MQVQRDGRHDFDFFMGNWKLHNRRLRERLEDSNDWEVFEGRLMMHKILSGLGNFDEVSLYPEAGIIEGVNLRLYNPDTYEWSIYWASSAGANNIFPPMIGKFENGRGAFYAYEPIAGQHLYTRAIWTILNEDASRWEQAFSSDGGQTWETNWIVDFTRED